MNSFVVNGFLAASFVTAFGISLLATPNVSISSQLSLVASRSAPAAQPATPVLAPVQVELPPPPPMRYVPGLEEPLVATGPVSEQENRELDQALVAFHAAPASFGPNSDFDDFAQPLLGFVSSHPVSNWNSALYLDIGLGYYHSAYYSRTFDYFNKSWQLGRNATSVEGKRMADRAMGELAEMHARLGHADELKAFFADIGDRPISGPAQFMMQGAHDGLSSFEHRPDIAYLCGPAALRNMLIWLKARPEQIKVADDARSGPHGVSLSSLAALANKAGLKYSLVYREPGQPIPVPSIINWDVHHYAAILDERDGHYRLMDPTFGAAGSLVTERVADSEGSGYFLVPAKVMAANPNSGWRQIADNSAEAKSVYGMGNVYTQLPGACKPCQKKSAPANGGMTVASSTLATASLNLSDTPIGYSPQEGLSAKVTISYNARDGDQPAIPQFSNLSPQWTHNWQAYVQDDPNNAGSNVKRIIGGGGGYDYDVLSNLNQTVYNTSTGAFTPETYDNSQLVRIPASGSVTSYVRNLPDGGQETYGLSNGSTVLPRLMFLTAVTDSAGNQTRLNYDSQFRLVSIMDATGRSTTFSYGLPQHAFLITKITDPFGRYSTMTYDTSQRLSSITDPIGITSSYTYGSSTETNFITRLTTPYGVSNFSDTLDPAYNETTYLNQSLAITDPLGNVDYSHIYQNINPTVTGTGSETATPVGMLNDNTLLMWRNTFHWDAHEAASGGVTTDIHGNPTGEVFSNADIYHWFHLCCTVNYLSDQLASHKRPLEEYREWYNTTPVDPTYYPGAFSGILDTPTFTGRALTDSCTQASCTQLSSSTYNSLGNLLTHTDPIGRETSYAYATNNIDVLDVSQKTGPSSFSTIASYSNYNTKHEPQTFVGADGKTWGYTYNSSGQLWTVTDPKLEVTTYHYDPLNRLSTVTDANNQTVLTLTYDSADRVQTRTDSQSYTLTYGYDNADRVISVTYPDGTAELNDYTFQSGIHAGSQSLDLRKHTDRLGRVTIYGYDADRRLTSVTEPASGSTTRTTNYDYYENGTLKDVVDANGNKTYWAIDLEGRPTSKTYALGSGSLEREQYTYEATNSRLHSIIDNTGQVKTFTYAQDNRVSGITYTNSTNATPNVSFTYDPYFPRLSTMVDGTGTTSYGYTPIGTNGALKPDLVQGPYGTNDAVTLSYDSLGRLYQRDLTGGNETLSYDSISRLSSHVTPLGNFVSGYLGETSQLTRRSLTNGTITVSTAWGYDTNVNDRRLISITNSGATRSYTLGYTAGSVTNPYDILSITDTAASGSPLSTQSHAYGYDNVDRLLSATATVSGNNIYGYDAVDNATTITTPTGTVNPTYNVLNQLATSGSNTYVYDGNGNTLSGDSVRTYKWDAENRLIEIDYVGTSSKTVFGYNGMDERVSDAETVGSTTTTTYSRWCGSRICQSWNASGNALIRRDLDEGELNVATGQKLVYMPDQLGSVRDVLDASTGSNLKSTDYAPFGSISRYYGTTPTDYQYASLLLHPASGLNLSASRAMDGVSGRWLNRDPIREYGGINLYAYVSGSPIYNIDSAGKSTVPVTSEPWPIPNPVEEFCSLAPEACVVGAAGAAGIVAGSLAYPFIEPSLSQLIDSCMNNKQQACKALYDSVIRTCWGMPTGRKRMRCFEAARRTYEACMSEN